MEKFNNGKPYHGSDKVMKGKLTGATDYTDYFYFFCPNCSGKNIMRILEYTLHHRQDKNPYNDDFVKKAKEGFTLAFKLICEKCSHVDFVKISNTGWQGGTHDEVLRKGSLS